MGGAIVNMGGQSSKERLSKADMDFLMMNTQYDEATIQEWYKGFMADCPDGRLNTNAFKEILLAINVTSNGNPEEKLNWAFSMYDVDGNGWIDLQEMTKIVKSIYAMMGPNHRAELVETPEQRAEDIFRRMMLTLMDVSPGRSLSAAA